MTKMKRSWFVPLAAAACLFACLAARAGTNDAEGYYRAGLDLYRKGEYEQSLRYFDAALQRDASHWQSRQAKGQALYILGRRPEALVAYRESLKIHPDNPVLKAAADRLALQFDPDAAAPLAAPEAAPAAKPVGTPIAHDAFMKGLSDRHWQMEFEVFGGTAMPLGNFASSHNPAWHLSGSYGTKFSPFLSFLGAIEYCRFTTKNPVQLSPLEGRLRLVTGELLLKWRFVNAPIRPFAVGGAGFASVVSSFAPDPAAWYSYDQESEFDLLTLFGGGVEWAANQKTHFFAQVRYGHIRTGTKIGAGGAINFMPASVGVNFYM